MNDKKQEEKNKLKKILSVTSVEGVSFFRFDRETELNGNLPCTLMIYNDGGALSLTLDGVSVPLPAERTAFLAPGREYRVAARKGCSVAVVAFETQAGINEYFDGRSFPTDAFRKELIGKILGCADELFERRGENSFLRVLREEPSEHAAQVARECLELLLLDCVKPLYKPFKHSTEAKGRLSESKKTTEEILSYLQENVTRNVKISEIAEALFFSESYVKKVFRKETGVGIIRYFTSMKIAKAKEYLAEGKSTAETAKRLGFSSSAYFCKVFRQETGVTTKRFRASALR